MVFTISVAWTLDFLLFWNAVLFIVAVNSILVITVIDLTNITYVHTTSFLFLLRSISLIWPAQHFDYYWTMSPGMFEKTAPRSRNIWTYIFSNNQATLKLLRTDTFELKQICNCLFIIKALVHRNTDTDVGPRPLGMWEQWGCWLFEGCAAQIYCTFLWHY